jgi:hypothetical protein
MECRARWRGAAGKALGNRHTKGDTHTNSFLQGKTECLNQEDLTFVREISQEMKYVGVSDKGKVFKKNTPTCFHANERDINPTPKQPKCRAQRKTSKPEIH